MKYDKKKLYVLIVTFVFAFYLFFLLIKRDPFEFLNTTSSDVKRIYSSGAFMLKILLGFMPVFSNI